LKKWTPTALLEAYYQRETSTIPKERCFFDPGRIEGGASYRLSDHQSLRLGLQLPDLSRHHAIDERLKLKQPYTYHIGTVSGPMESGKRVPRPEFRDIGPGPRRRIEFEIEKGSQRT